MIPNPRPTDVVAVVDPPHGLTASRADLVVWWRWRFAALQGELTRLEDLLVQVLGESQSYRAVLQSAFDALHEQRHQHDRPPEQHRRLRDEYRDHRERVRRDEHRHRGGRRRERDGGRLRSPAAAANRW